MTGNPCDSSPLEHAESGAVVPRGFCTGSLASFVACEGVVSNMSASGAMFGCGSGWHASRARSLHRAGLRRAGDRGCSSWSSRPCGGGCAAPGGRQCLHAAAGKLSTVVPVVGASQGRRRVPQVVEPRLAVDALGRDQPHELRDGDVYRRDHARTFARTTWRRPGSTTTGGGTSGRDRDRTRLGTSTGSRSTIGRRRSCRTFAASADTRSCRVTSRSTASSMMWRVVDWSSYRGRHASAEAIVPSKTGPRHRPMIRRRTRSREGPRTSASPQRGDVTGRHSTGEGRWRGARLRPAEEATFTGGTPLSGGRVRCGPPAARWAGPRGALVGRVERSTRSA